MKLVNMLTVLLDMPRNAPARRMTRSRAHDHHQQHCNSFQAGQCARALEFSLQLIDDLFHSYPAD
jgi:hypothetical protein